MTYLFWLATALLVVSAVRFAIKATKALYDMQASVNANRDAGQKIEIRFSWDWVRVQEEYRRIDAKGVHLARYRWSMFGFFASGILATACFLVNAWYIMPVK